MQNIQSIMSFAITSLIIYKYQTKTSSKTITLKEYDTSSKPYTLVDQDNVRYLVDETVWDNANKLDFMAKTPSPLRTDDSFNIIYNKSNKITNMEKRLKFDALDLDYVTKPIVPNRS